MKFAELDNIEISRDDLNKAIRLADLDLNAPHRSLAECQDILENLGIETEAKHLLFQGLKIPKLGIMYLGQGSGSVGHVVVVSSAGSGIANVHDPSFGEQGTLRVIDDLGVDGTYFIVPRESGSERWSILIRVMTAALVLLLFLVHKNRFLVLALAVCSLALLTSCRGEPASNGYFSAPNHDFGVVRLDGKLSERFEIQHKFELINGSNFAVKVNRFVSSCGCLAAKEYSDGIVIAPGTKIYVPVSVDLSSKRFREGPPSLYCWPLVP